MGRITKGILGGFSGKVGTVIGSTWKGVDYMRSKPGKRKGQPSALQMDQQARFRLVQGFLNSISPLLPTSFKTGGSNMTGHNLAQSYNLKNAVTGSSPNFTLDFTKLLVSRGDLPNATSPTAAKTGTDVDFSWTSNAGTGTALGTDSTLLVVHCPGMKESIFSLGTSQRADATETIDCSRFAGKQVETFMGFVSANGRDAATSVHVGTLSL